MSDKRYGTVTSDQPREARQGQRRRWPLLVIGGSAGTATWSGWVGLGGLTGFGLVHPLPGIWEALTLNTAITLPIGVEAYAVYALSVATDARSLSAPARRYAWASAGMALVVGMAGQIAYHLLNAAGVSRAPWWVVTVVSCLPVAILGAAALLWHLAAGSGDGAAGAPTSPDVSPAGSSEASRATSHDRSSDSSSRHSTRVSSRRRLRADDEVIRALVAQARTQRPGAGEPAVRRLLTEAGLSASGARVRSALRETTPDRPG